MAIANPPRRSQIARDIERVLSERLPSDWSLRARTEALVGRSRIDLLVTIASPGGETARLGIEIKRTLDPRQVSQAAEQISTLASDGSPESVPIVAAAYLSPRTRELLSDVGVGYVDTTGNVRIETPMPRLFILTDGANQDPWPQAANLSSLRGRGAARAMRAIVDTTPPFGVRELASTTSATAPTISRVLTLLEREGIVTREERGPVFSIDWQAAIRRWATDYDQTGSNTPTFLLEPRGLRTFETELSRSDLAYAATGAFAAQHFDPIAPARSATLYVVDAMKAAERLGLRETEAGANVMLLEPFDPVVFDGVIERDGLRCVAPSQLAVDLLTGPGREPSQGEEILQWMKDNEDTWQR